MILLWTHYSADNDDDYTIIESAVTFNSSDAVGSTKCFSINITDDMILEMDETFSAVILTSNGGFIGTCIVTIEDNDGEWPLPGND